MRTAEAAQIATAGFPEIGEYAAIGDCRTCALVSSAGAIEWLCLPDYSSPSFFGAMLDRNAGHFSIAPRTWRRVRRSYVGDSNVLCTRFEGEGGVLELTDALALTDPRGGMQPQLELLRKVECVEGEVE